MRAESHGIGARLRVLRKHRRLTLGMLGKRSGYSASALSKMENDRLGLSYDKLYRLAVALDVDITTLFNESSEVEEPRGTGRRSIAHKGGGKTVASRNYEYRYVSPELNRKHLVPIIVRPHARTLEEFGPLIRHGGEEWIYVLKGEIDVCTEFYAPERLRKGDSIYLDSRMGHAFLERGKVPAEFVCVCSAPAADLLEENDSERRPPVAKAATTHARRTRLRSLDR